MPILLVEIFDNTNDCVILDVNVTFCLVFLAGEGVLLPGLIEKKMRAFK